jgi:hypothetical protein
MKRFPAAFIVAEADEVLRSTSLFGSEIAWRGSGCTLRATGGKRSRRVVSGLGAFVRLGGGSLNP